MLSPQTCPHAKNAKPLLIFYILSSHFPSTIIPSITIFFSEKGQIEYLCMIIIMAGM